MATRYDASGTMFVIEPDPSGQQTIQNAIKWMADLSQAVDDARDLWQSITPEIKRSIKYEFSAANPNKWAAISEKYKEWKAERSYPATIGVRTGALKEAVSDSAIIKYYNTRLSWEINPAVRSGEYGPTYNPSKDHYEENVGEYADSFNDARRIFNRTIDFIGEAMRAAVRKFIKDNTTK